MNYLIAGFIGLLSGFTSGIFGVGGGVIMVPTMMFFLKMDIKLAIGTSLAVIIPTALTGTMRHHSQGQVDWRVVLMLVPTAILGGYCGAWMTAHLSSESLKRAFGGFLVLAGFRLLFFK